MLRVAIDGPSGTGKSTIAKAVAARFGLEYIDTGAMYRALGLKALRNGVDAADEAAVKKMLDETVIVIGTDYLVTVLRKFDSKHLAVSS